MCGGVDVLKQVDEQPYSLDPIKKARQANGCLKSNVEPIDVSGKKGVKNGEKLTKIQFCYPVNLKFY